MADDPLVGKVLHDTHEVLRLIGKGGMGSVYEARHIHLNKSFAVKVLDPRFADNDTVFARFKREALIASSLGHPAIVQVVDFYLHDDGRPCMVMEHLVGKDLGAVLKDRSTLPPEEMLDIVEQVAGALQAVHDKKIVHRDMKPGNIFLAEQEDGSVQAKVLDFGISKFKSPDEGGETLTTSDTILGTPHFMSPEQALGEVGDVDWRTDIFALATICYYVMSGKLPFNAPSLHGVLVKIQTMEPSPITGIAPNVSGKVHLVLQKAMAKDKARRYERVEQFARDFREAVACEADEDAETAIHGDLDFPTMVHKPNRAVEGAESSGVEPGDSLRVQDSTQPADSPAGPMEHGRQNAAAPAPDVNSDPSITSVVPLDEILAENSSQQPATDRTTDPQGASAKPAAESANRQVLSKSPSGHHLRPGKSLPNPTPKVSPDTTLSGSAGELPTKRVQPAPKAAAKYVPLGAAIVILLLSGVFVLISGSDELSESPQATVSTKVRPNVADAPKESPASTNSKGEVPTPSAAPAAGHEPGEGPTTEPLPIKDLPAIPAKQPSKIEKVKITFSLRPTRAQVSIDGKAIAENPVYLVKGSKQHRLLVKARGFVSFQQDLLPDRDQVVKVTLVRARAQARQRPPTRTSTPGEEWADPFHKKARRPNKNEKNEDVGFSSLEAPPPKMKPAPKPKPKTTTKGEGFESL